MSTYNHVLVSWTDPTTPPQTKISCVSYGRAFGVKFCKGYKAQTRVLQNSVVLSVTVPDRPIDTVKAAVVKTLKSASVLAATAVVVAAYVKAPPSAPAAKAAFLATFKAEFKRQLAGGVVRLNQRSAWTSWS
jgi:hypothetical protein